MLFTHLPKSKPRKTRSRQRKNKARMSSRFEPRECLISPDCPRLKTPGSKTASAVPIRFFNGNLKIRTREAKVTQSKSNVNNCQRAPLSIGAMPTIQRTKSHVQSFMIYAPVLVFLTDCLIASSRKKLRRNILSEGHENGANPGRNTAA